MTGAVRIVQRNALVYRRVWRGSVFSSFLQPTLFLLAMGFGLGAMIDPAAASLPGGVSYVEFLAPGLLAAAGMQVATFESTYPVLGKMTWHRNYEAITATPMRVSDLVSGELMWIALRLSTIAAAFVVVMVAFGIPRSLARAAGRPGDGADGPRVFGADHGVRRDAQEHGHVQRAVPIRHDAAVHVFGRVLPRRAAAGMVAARGMVHAAVPRGRARPWRDA